MTEMTDNLVESQRETINVLKKEILEAESLLNRVLQNYQIDETNEKYRLSSLVDRISILVKILKDTEEKLTKRETFR